MRETSAILVRGDSTLFRARTMLVALALALALTVSVKTPVSASTVSEDFAGNGSFKPGLLVSGLPDGSGDVALATIANSNYLIGVVQVSGSGLVNYTKGGSTVSVATSGLVQAYVNDANGAVKKGDYIGASWVDGVGMKVTEGDSHKDIAVAQEDFNTSSATDLPDITTPSGKKTVKIGAVTVRLLGAPHKQLASDQSGVTGFTAKLVGHQVTYARAILGTLLFVFTLFTAGVFMRSSIKHSFVSLGRNPLVAPSIYKSMLQVSVMSMAIILIGTFIAYIVVAI